MTNDDVLDEKIMKLKDVAKLAWKNLDSREELESMVEEDLTINIATLDIASLDTPKINHKYMKILNRTKEVMNQFNHIEKNVRAKLMLYYSGKTKPRYPIRVDKFDVKHLIDGNDVYNDIAFQLNLVKDRLKYLQSVIEEVNRRNFHVSNIIKFNKFKSGESN